MLTLTLILFGFVLIMILTSWLATIFLASAFPIFNFKDDFIEYWIRTRGTPPSRRRLVLSAYGAANFFFRAEISNDQHRPDAIRLIPNRNSAIFLVLGIASLAAAALFWIAAFILFTIVKSHF